MNFERYEKAEMEIIEFECDDVITTSGLAFCSTETPADGNDDMW